MAELCKCVEDWWAGVSQSDASIKAYAEIAEFFRAVTIFARLAQELPSSFEQILSAYLHSWDGESNKDAIFELLTHIHPQNFDGTDDQLLHRAYIEMGTKAGPSLRLGGER
ncbi:hypothetical protein HK104_002621 [Borealophlyctis nickersoniae]|nr:hypothetical protein HK104_002621 [Borealophlyctis nickersoniae]